MAKMQRWRRSRSAGEGTTAPDIDSETPEVDAEIDGEVDVEVEGEVDSENSEIGAGLDGEQDDLLPEAEGEDPADPAGLGGSDESPDDELEDVDVMEVAEADDDDEAAADAEEDAHALPRADQSRVSAWLLGGRSPANVVAVQLLQAAHAKQAITTALAMALVAAIAGRPAREAGVVLLTVLVGQTILGWHNDIVDRQRDQAHGLTGKPLAMGRIDVGTAWYAIVVATLLLIPLATMTGVRAGALYVASMAVAMLGNVLLRTGPLSWWSWALSFALLPAYLSYGGWGGQAVGSAPEPAIVILAALLGVGVHFMRAVWGLVADHEDGWTYLPLKLGLKLGATRLLAFSTLYTAVIVILLLIAGARVGLSR